MSDPVHSEWGRVGADGTVYVRTSAGERVVGSWQADAPAEGLAFFARRYDDLETQVALLEQRLQSGTVAPDVAASTIGKLSETIAGAAAVGDLDGLLGRLAALGPVVEQRRAERRAARQAAAEESRARKSDVVDQAERIAASTDWRSGSTRLRELLEEWKQLPRLDRSVDDELWHRFSTARTTYTRRRKAHFAELDKQREAARAAKEALVAQAEELAGSTEWGPTTVAMRDLMARWKQAGRAPREVDDELWARFRAAQDAFFAARDAANAERDAEFTHNLQAKQALLVEAEALLPVTDARAARRVLRDIHERWAAIGKVPREALREVEGRMRAVEAAVDAAAQEAWRASNPEARARAQSTVSQLRESVAALEQDRQAAVAAGDDTARRRAEEAITARRAWLEQAEATLAEFGG